MSAPYRYPQTHVFYRKLTRHYPKIIRGEGCWLFDEDNKSYLDACGGAYVANLGHGVAEVAQAMSEQAAKIAYVNGTVFTNEPLESLAAEVAKLSPGDLKKVYFLSSGSEAVEAALKLARQYCLEAGRPSKHKIIATAPGYHGNTLLALSTSARGSYKTCFKDWLVQVPMIPSPYPYRCPCRGKRQDCRPNQGPAPAAAAPRADCPICSGAALEEAVLREGPDTVAAFIIEPIGGSSTGASVPRPDYFKRIRDICDRYQILLIADEVLTGAGRTGTWTAMEHYGVTPDIFTLGKGLSGGYVPLSAVVASQRIIDVLAKGSGSLLHAQTFSHTPTICAAGLAAVRYLEKNRLIERARDMGPTLHKSLSSLRELTAVGDVRGLGMLAGIEFVQDKATREPFPRKLKFAETFVENALKEGLILWPNTGQAGEFMACAEPRRYAEQGGQADAGDLVTIAPPFSITNEEIDEIVARFKSALHKTLDRAPALKK